MATATTKNSKAPVKAASPPPAASAENKTRPTKAAPAVRGKTTVAAKKGAMAKVAPAAAVQVAKPTTVTLRQFAASLAERHALPKKQAEALVADVFGDVVAHLKAGERVRIGGLGVIEVKSRPARVARNPATGAPVQVAASKKIAFRAAKELKEAI